MDLSSIRSSAKRYGAKTLSWVAMVLVTAVAVVFIGHYFLPRAMELMAPPVIENRSNGDETQQYDIQEIITAVRSELVATQSALVANEEDAMFQLETFDIELSFVVTRGVKANANVETPMFLVVGTDTEYKKEQVQNIHLHFSVDKPPPFRPDIVDEILNKNEAVDLN